MACKFTRLDLFGAVNLKVRYSENALKTKNTPFQSGWEAFGKITTKVLPRVKHFTMRQTYTSV